MSSETQSFKGVGTPTTRMYGLMAVVALGWVFLGGLFFTPEDAVQGDAVRIMYVRVPTAWVAYLAFIVTGIASACWLLGKKHSMGFDRVAGASAEVGVLFMAMTLLSGSLWGRITWGTFWVWDPRLTTTAFLFVTMRDSISSSPARPASSSGLIGSTKSLKPALINKGFFCQYSAKNCAGVNSFKNNWYIVLFHHKNRAIKSPC
mgnify:CR=1 FL=1